MGGRSALPVQHGGPVGVSFADVAGDVPGPFFPDFLVEVQIKLIVNNRPRLGIDVSRGPTAYRPRSVAAVLGSVFFRISFEKIEVLLFREEPADTGPLEGKIFNTLNGRHHREVRDGVIPLQSGAGIIDVDRGKSPCGGE
jgi:hypothetical protein